jgi:hypothetical protein
MVFAVLVAGTEGTNKKPETRSINQARNSNFPARKSNQNVDVPGEI